VAVSGEPLLVAAVDDIDHQDEITTHELEHVLQALLVPRAPRWLKEGLAEYASSLQFEDGERGPVVAFGAPKPGRAFSWRDGLDLAPYLRDDWSAVDADDQRRAYAVGWVVTDYLLEKRTPELFAWMQKLGPVPGKVPTLLEAFPGLTFDGLREETEQHLRKSNYKRILYPSPPWTGPVSVRKLRPAEALVALGELVAPGPEQTLAAAQALAQAFVLRAYAEGPLEPAALYAADAYQPEAGRAERAKACAQAHPEDWRCPALGAAVPTLTQAERLKQWERAARLGPEAPAVLGHLARALVDQPKEAQQAARAASVALTALRGAPSNTYYLYVLALARAAQGRCQDARDVSARALGLASLHRRAEVPKWVQGPVEACAEGPPPALPTQSGK
jgi:hypothetical protein